MFTSSILALSAAATLAAQAPETTAVSSAAIGSGSSNLILIALAVVIVGAVGSLVAGDIVRKREQSRRGQMGL